MKRLTTNKPETMMELSNNQCFVRGREAWFRDFKREIPCRDFARQLLKIHTDADYTKRSDEDFDECIFDVLQYGETDIEGLIAMYYYTLCALAEVREALKRYEDAEEQGLLVRLPCKQGDYVYFIKSSFSYAKTPMKYRIIGFRKYAEGEIVTYVCVNDYGRNRTFTSHDIGKTVFLTCEDAEQALKEVHHEQS